MPRNNQFESLLKFYFSTPTLLLLLASDWQIRSPVPKNNFRTPDQLKIT
ncbi:Uncharacterized protein dnm_008050 [Desulfonema magnum]|uniref:Uncharacterized protein n=1 Tax=Desulfonema magnum TaxID=45655 RepID=A0A975BGU8_9BACT|nr:Uncharacterized protein dnm_008050 [Desulfonema magnum]